MLPSKLQGVEGCSHCAGNKAELFTGLRQALGLEEMPSRFRVISVQPLEPWPSADRYYVKMRGGRAAFLCGLQPQFLQTVATCRSAVFPRNKRRYFSSRSVPSVHASEVPSLGEGLHRVAPFPTGCCKGQAGLLDLLLLHTALSTLFQSPVLPF